MQHELTKRTEEWYYPRSSIKNISWDTWQSEVLLPWLREKVKELATEPKTDSEILGLLPKMEIPIKDVFDAVNRQEERCPNCGGDKNIRNPTGNCDHLYYPENVKNPHQDCWNLERRKEAYAKLITEMGWGEDAMNGTIKKHFGITESSEDKIEKINCDRLGIEDIKKIIAIVREHKGE